MQKAAPMVIPGASYQSPLTWIRHRCFVFNNLHCRWLLTNTSYWVCNI